MATLREVRRRIGGIRKTQKITRAMKMVAAARLRRAQAEVVAARPYAAKIRELLAHLVSRPGAGGNELMVPREVRGVALVVVTGDRGLSGAFNSNLLKAVLNHVSTRHAEIHRQGRLQVFCVGRKGADFLTRRSFRLAGRFTGVFARLVFPTAQEIAREVIDGYRRGDYDLVEIIYNEFKSVAQQRITVEQFLPVQPEHAGEATAHLDYIYEPASPAILAALLPRQLNFQIWHVLLESSAAEEGARMVAMDNATENADELISHLQLQYNKARQAAITKELLEVVAGADALSQSG